MYKTTIHLEENQHLDRISASKSIAGAYSTQIKATHV